MASLAAAGVALVILVDLATGQGPPIYTNYLRGQQESQMMPPPPPMAPMQAQMMPVQYDQPMEYAIPVGPRLDLEGKNIKDNYEIDGYGKEAKKEEKDIKNKYENDDYGKEEMKGEKDDKLKYNKDEESKTTKPPGLYDRIMKNFG